LHQQGRLDHATDLLLSLLRDKPSDVDALLRLGVVRLQQARPADALPLLQHAAELAPDSATVLANLGTVLQALGRSEEAIAALETALVRQPDFTDARYALATTLQATGQLAPAAACFETLLAATPGHVEAMYGLATIHLALGNTDGAMAQLRAVLGIDPDFAEANVALGEQLLQQGHHNEAAARFRQALDVDPDYVEARIGLGRSLCELDRAPEAEAALLAVLRAEPDQTAAKCALATLRHKQKRDAEALTLCRDVLARDSAHGGALLGQANALKSLGRMEESLAAFRAAVAMNPGWGEAYGGLGEALAEFGQLDAARNAFQHAMALLPNDPGVCLRLTQLGKVRPDDPVTATLQALESRIETLPQNDQMRLQFALAKAKEDLGSKDEAFRHLLAGNAAYRRTIRYDEPVVLQTMRRVADLFTPEVIAARSGLGDPSSLPIFIVGMPRSGSTLVEQVLASHPMVFGAGERSELGEIVQRFVYSASGGLPNLELLLTLDAAKLRAIGSDYVAAMHALAPDAPRITDKLLGNFVRVGLIHLILPHARIIHTVRDPVDSCLSSFSRLFAPGDLPFCYDLAELGRYYHGYVALMAHWRSVLPHGVLLEVQYENVVDDLETNARRILEHCGLPWDDACLAFHELQRPVRTSSVAQVRQPLYRTSVGRWRPDAETLEPLLDGLAGRQVA
jgi:tetratricopeptide (TPR) repeat protein